MALGANARPWKEVVGWKAWADATKSAPYNAADRIFLSHCSGEGKGLAVSLE